MTKSQQYFQDMMENHRDLFDDFKKIHDAYVQNPEKMQKEYNTKGEDILALIRRYENMLCNQSEGGRYGKFSANLAEKFWELIRKSFPKIDFIGIQ